jgi:hypothetical protein
VGKQTTRGLQSSDIWPLLSVSPEAAHLLLNQLNATGEGPDVQAVREMVRNMNEVDRIVRSKGYLTVVNQRVGSTVDELAMNLEAQLDKHGFDKSVLELMTKIRATYEAFSLRLRPVFPMKHGWQFSWMNPWSGDPEQRGLVAWTFLSIIHDFAQAGYLNRVRECKICGKWFFAYRESPRFQFCSDECREKHWRTSPQGKEKRAAFMRNYRSGLKRRKRENLRWSNKHAAGRK